MQTAKGDRRHFEVPPVPVSSSGWEPEHVDAPGSAGSLMRRVVVFTRTLLCIDSDEPESVDPTTS